MKRWIALLLLMLLLLCGCSRTQNATLVLTCYDHNIVQELTPEESREVSRILGSLWLGDPFGVPACGFGPDVAIKLGGSTYMIAKDQCASVRKGTVCYTISDQDMEYIHSLFEKYSGQPWDGGYN